MKIKITRGTVVGGRAVREGEVVSASAEDAALLIRMGKAEPVRRKRRRATTPRGERAMTTE